MENKNNKNNKSGFETFLRRWFSFLFKKNKTEKYEIYEGGDYIPDIKLSEREYFN